MEPERELINAFQRDYQVQIEVIPDETINAQYNPSLDRVELYSGMIDFLKEIMPDEYLDPLAFLIGHEIGHKRLNHSFIRVQSQGRMESRISISGQLQKARESKSIGGDNLGQGRLAERTVTEKEMKTRFERRHELEADKFSKVLLNDRGIGIESSVQMFRILESQQYNDEKSIIYRYFNNHPPYNIRIEHLLNC